MAILLKDRCACKAKELGIREEVAYGRMVLAKLTAMALVKDKDDAFVAKSLESQIEAIVWRWV